MMNSYEIVFRWPEGSVERQAWALPFNIIRYIADNPTTPEVYEKLIKTCKYFFGKNSILVAKKMVNDYICDNDQCDTVNGCARCIRVDFNKLRSVIWLTGEMVIRSDWTAAGIFEPLVNGMPQMSKMLQMKCLYSTINELELHSDTITVEELKYVASSAAVVRLYGPRVVDENDEPVQLDQIVSIFPRIEEFYLTCKIENAAIVDKWTPQKLSKLTNLGRLRRFCLPNMFCVMDLTDLGRFIERTPLDGRIIVEFYQPSLDYCRKLDEVIDSLLARDFHNFYLYYRGMDIPRAVRMSVSSRCRRN